MNTLLKTKSMDLQPAVLSSKALLIKDLRLELEISLHEAFGVKLSAEAKAYQQALRDISLSLNSKAMKRLLTEILN